MTVWLALAAAILVAFNGLSAGICARYASRRELLSQYYCPFSIAWAWGARHEWREVGEAQAVDVEALARHREPRSILFNWPWNNVVILLILFYQHSNQVPGLHICAMTPNCSNYALGMFRRYGFIYAGFRSWRRINSCGEVVGFNL